MGLIAVNANKIKGFSHSSVTFADVLKPYEAILGNRCSIRLSYGTIELLNWV